MVKTICSKCKKEYGAYPVFITTKDESLAMEFSIRDIYYDEERNIGLCEECRKEIWKDKIGVWRLWLLARVKIIVLRAKYKEEKNFRRVRELNNALKRIDEKDKELGRNYILIEREREYYDTIIKRIKSYQDQKRL